MNNNSSVNIVDAQIVFDMACGKWDVEGAPGAYGKLLEALSKTGTEWNLATLEAAADVNVDNSVDAIDARAIQAYAHAGAFA